MNLKLSRLKINVIQNSFQVSTSKVINVGKSFNILVVDVSLYNSMILSSEQQLSMPEHKVLHWGVRCILSIG